jgi:uncharacterized protein (TIGR02996 family)
MSTDTEHLLAAILDNPEEDTPRLIYADCIEELEEATTEPCPACSVYVDDPCPHCDGRKQIREFHGESNDKRTMSCPTCRMTGKFPPGYRPERDPGGWTNCKTCNDGGPLPYCSTPGFVRTSNGMADRAEFIRVQIELANRPFGWGLCGTGGKHADWCARDDKKLAACNAYGHRGDNLRARERDLIAAHPEWLPKCPTCNGAGVVEASADTPELPLLMTTFRATCSPCKGVGRIGTFDRGFLNSVTVPHLQTLMMEGDDDVMRPTPWARDLVANWPTVERVIAADLVPDEQDTVTKVRWVWWAEEGIEAEGHGLDGVCPIVLFERLWQDWKPQRYENEVRSMWFASREDAVDALAECVCLVLKEMCAG